MTTGDWVEHCIATAALIVVLVWVWHQCILVGSGS